jgi:hypothetical protein
MDEIREALAIAMMVSALERKHFVLDTLDEVDNRP